ncbi:DUF6036 family nucleotidyltransferase [Pedobacter montanisoli]|uniref:DUF6036 domain-containing protein n=1 Tax=Pedobacter montanisoli TaxID=2923277 RepID=A0ABS9ZYM6_9SPHI|nr:DUF6036 family nucleotidyltransferase [Pedobacter montanisoli]MCJ0743390.1 hypothetical protein [Pedobacter montanisoli]
MDVFDDEILTIWRSFNKNNVRFIMVGGVATNLHGFLRTTADIDMWIEDSPDNRKNLRKALKECAVGDFPSIESMTFVPGWTDFNLTSGMRLDMMTSVKGLEEYGFENSLQMASIASIYDVEVPFLHINQLIEAKKASNRPKDQIDVIELENIKKLRDTNTR